MSKDETGISPAALAAIMSGNVENTITATTPGGIEAQEARGQQTFVQSETLPREMLHGCTREILEQMGIVFGDDVDDLFISATLPDGWAKRPTGHSMWSDLVDDKGRKRASIFYKAAFYDRSAHISLNRRFSYNCEPENRYQAGQTYEERQAGNWYGVAWDGEAVAFKTAPKAGPTYDEECELSDQAKAWLDEHYPDHANPLAYWD